MRSHLFGFLSLSVVFSTRIIPDRLRHDYVHQVANSNLIDYYYNEKNLIDEPRRFVASSHLFNSEPHVNAFESIPVEIRVSIIEKLLSKSQRNSIYRMVESFKDPITRQYAEYLESLIYTEIGVIRLLYRFALYRLEPEEGHIRTAFDMSQFLRLNFAKKYNYSLEHITPDVVDDLYNVIIPAPGRKWDTRSNMPDSIHSRFYANPNIGPLLNETAIVQMDLTSWRLHVLANHRDRLVLTGYEFL